MTTLGNMKLVFRKHGDSSVLFSKNAELSPGFWAVFFTFILCLFFARGYAAEEFTPVSASKNFYVDPYTGSANFAIPIYMPPARKTLPQKLNLVYSSRAGNGWLGVGWKLDLAVIERSTKNGYPLYSASDKFVFSLGEQQNDLVLVGGKEYRAKTAGLAWKFTFDGNYWTVKDNLGNTYYFGQDNYLADFSRTKDPANAGKVFRWRLSKITDTSGNNIIFKYSADKIEIYYSEKTEAAKTSYKPQDYNYLISINFSADRKDKLSNYRPGFSDSYPLDGLGRVSEVKILCQDQLVRRYALEYQYSAVTGRSILNKVTEFGSDNQTVNPPVKFNYSNSAFEYQTVKYNKEVGDSWRAPWRIRYADNLSQPAGNFKLTPDGLVDDSGRLSPVSWSKPYNTETGNSAGFSWTVKPSATDDIQHKKIGNLHVEGKPGQVFHAWTYIVINAWADGNRQYSVAGSNNCNANYYLSDSQAQKGPYPLAQAVSFGNLYNLKKYIYRLDVTGYNFSGNFSLDYNIAENLSYWETINASGEIIIPTLSGDFNGDGAVDLANFEGANSLINVAASNKRDFQQNNSWGANNYVSVGSKPLLGDFNGDGKTDLAGGVSGGKIKVAISDGSKFVDKGLWFSGVGGTAVSGDFNGDCLTDFCYFTYSGTDLYATPYFSDGQSFKLQSKFKFSNLAYEKDDQFFTGDFNGDGVTDFAFWKKAKKTLEIRGYNNSWSTSIIIDDPRVVSSDFKLDFSGDFNFDGKSDLFFYNLKEPSFYMMNLFGSGAKTPVKLNLDFGAGYTGDVFANPLQIGDFNGDGVTDFLIYDFFKGTQVAYSTTSDVSDLLLGVDNGWGAGMEFKYRLSSEYDSLNSGITPKLPFAIPLISEVKISDGLGASYKTGYLYSKGYYDTASREFRGFSYVSKTDDDGNLTEISFLQDDIYKGKISEQKISDKYKNIFYKVVNTWGSSAPYPGTAIVYLSETNQYSYDGSASYKQKRSTSSYDAYGNQILLKEWTDTGGTGELRQAITEFTYNTTDWLVSYPSHTYILDQAGNKFQEKWFYYDTKGRLIKLEAGIYNPLTKLSVKATSAYTYDAFGNIVKVVDPLARATTTEYDTALKTYPVKVTNAVGQITQYTYEQKTGQVLTTTDLNKQVKKYTYDALGRLIRVVGPLDTDSYPAITYQYDLSVIPNKMTKQVKSSYAAGQPNYLATYSFYDGLGRLIQQKSPAENDPQTNAVRQIVSDVVKYDSRGQVMEKYLPYFVATSSAYNTNFVAQPKFTYTYDCLGRATQVTSPNGTYTQNSYLNWVTTFTDENGHRSAQTQDALARIVKVEEYNSGQIYTTVYKYDASNNLVEVIDQQNNHTYFTYDSVGRKIRLVDPDMGSWNYEYDLVGNMIKQIDAKNQELVFTYDQLNRLSKKSSLRGAGSARDEAIYLYDDTAKTNCIGRLSKITEQSSISEYFYDLLGRQVKSVKTVDGAAFTIQREYDAIDRVTKLTYPDGEAVAYTYNAQGVEKIQGASAYATNVDYSPSSQISRLNYGNTAYTDYTYDAYTLRLTRIAAQSSQGNIQDLNYSFDGTGNIINIKDNINTNSQSFLYDDLNRMISAQGAYGAFSYNYDALGNILQKEGINYSYGGAKPHAVTSTSDGTNFSYDNNGNLIRKSTSSETQRFIYDGENHLIKVTKDQTQSPANKTLQIYLTAGINYISLPYGTTQQIKDLLSSIQSSREEVAYWDSNQNKCLYNINDANYDQFNNMDYSKGYWIYIKNPQGVTLTLTGKTPDTYQTSLKTGWNAIGCPKDVETNVEDALKPLQMGTDYVSVMRYNTANGAWQEYSTAKKEFTQLKPGEGYWLKASKDKTWNIENLPMGIPLAEFSYDSSGNRLKKTASGKTTVYIDSLYEKDSDGATRKHIFLGSTRICTRGLSTTGGLSLSFYHSDHLGSSNVITDAAGKQIQLTEYRPFGSLTKALPPAGTVPDYLYTGKELDRPTNLYYYGARYYNADLGKFIQPDPLIQDVYDPQTLNHYTYCRNNPLILTDPDGQSWESTFSSWGSSISSGWNSFNSWASSSYNSAMNSFNRSMDSIQRSINSFTTQAMTSFSSIGQSVWSETKIWGNAFSTGMGQIGNGFNSFGQATWSEIKIYGSALGLGINYGWAQVSNIYNPERATQIALEVANEYPRGHNEITDALRHAKWSKRMATEINQTTAFIAGWGHEIDNIINSQQPWNETIMDLNNNWQGRNAARNGIEINIANLTTIYPSNKGGPY